MVLVDGGLHALEPVGHLGAGVFFHRHLPGLVVDDHMVLEEGRHVLRDGRQRLAQRGKGRAVQRVGMAHHHDVGVGLVHGGMQHEAGAVDGVVAFHHLTAVVHQDEVGHLDLAEVHGHGVGPVQVGALGVADGQVTRKAVVKPLAREGPAGAHQALLEVLPLAGHVIESRPPREHQPRLAGLVDVLARFGQGIEAEFLLGGGRELFEEGGHGRGTCGREWSAGRWFLF